MRAPVLAALLLAACAHAPRTDRAPSFRLDGSVRPLRYRATLAVFRQSSLFSGNIDIELAIERPITTLWLHGVGLTIDRASLEVGGVTLPLRRAIASGDFIGFPLPERVEPGRARLHVEYRAHIADPHGYGIFRQFVDGNEFVFSQFEPTYARRVFPCFDEPSIKLPWQLSLVVRREDLALSNTPVVKTQGGSGAFPFKTVTFAPTQPIPSYDVAFAVGPFRVLDLGRVGARATPLRLLTIPGRDLRAFVLGETLPDKLARVERLLGSAYPYEKLDIVAIPLWTWFGGEENPGLITINERELFTDGVAGSVILHELAHQWLGDVITMRWWDDLWINEGSATWVAAKLSRDPLEGARTRSQALDWDSWGNLRAIHAPVTRSSQIEHFAHAAVYDKPAAVLAMLDGWLGGEQITGMLRRLIERHAAASVDAAAVLSATTEVAGPAAAGVLRSFLDTPGVPMVSGRLVCESGKPPVVRLTQQPFHATSSLAEPTHARWTIPVCLGYERDGGRGRVCAILDGERADVPLADGIGCPRWVLLDDGGTGYYLARYEDDLLSRLFASAGASLTTAERLSIGYDTALLAHGGALPWASALEAARSLASDPDTAVTAAILLGDWPASGLVSNADRPRYRQLLQATFAAARKRVGWRANPDATVGDRVLRFRLIPMLARLADDPELSAEARDLVRAWSRTEDRDLGDLSWALLISAGAYGDAQLFDELLEAARRSSAQHRPAVLGALGAFRDPALRQRALDLILSGEFPVEDGMTILLGVAMTDAAGANAAFAFVKNHLQRLFSEGGHDLTSAPWMLENACDEATATELERFGSLLVPLHQGEARERARRNVAIVLARIRACVAMKARDAAAWHRFLDSAPVK